VKIKTRKAPANKPPAAPPKCPACLDTAVVPRDGSPRVLTGEWSTVAEFRAKFKPCPFCPEGEREAQFWERFEALQALDLTPADVVEGIPGHAGLAEIHGRARQILDGHKSKAAGGDK
jgi:hypothetical protein